MRMVRPSIAGRSSSASSSSSSAKVCLKPSEASNVLLRSLQRLYSERKLFDVSITRNGQTLFGCHKLVLASCSSYFETLLSSTDGIAILNLDAVDADYVKHLRTIVDYMYGHNVYVPKTGGKGRELYEAARIFGVTALTKTLDIQLKSTNSSTTPAVRTKSRRKPPGYSSSALSEEANTSDTSDQQKQQEQQTQAACEDEIVVVKPCGIGSMLLVHFQRFKENEKFIDAKICCRDQLLFTCHKLVLASFSAYFETLLSKTEGAAILNLDAVDSLYVQQLSTLIDYMYGKTTWVKVDDLQLMQDAAHAFGVQALERGDLERLVRDNERKRVRKSLAGKLEKLRNGNPDVVNNHRELPPDNAASGPLQKASSTDSNSRAYNEEDTTAPPRSDTPLSAVAAVEEISSQAPCSDDHFDGVLPRHQPERKKRKQQLWNRTQPSSSSSVTTSASTNVITNGTGDQIRSYVVCTRGYLSSYELCRHCGGSFKRTAKGLRAHWAKHRIHHQQHQAVAPAVDGRRFKTEEQQPAVKCAECSETFHDISSLRSHWETIHGAEHDRRGCFRCGMVFSSCARLRAHTAACSSPTVLSTTTTTTATIDGEDSVGVGDGGGIVGGSIVKELICKACPFGTSSLVAFIRHVDTEHASKDVRCCICDCHFPDRQTLNEHYGQDHDVPMHRCEVCGKCFRTMPGYKYHLDTHKPSQQCSICSFVTNTTKNLDIHMKKYHPTSTAPAAAQTDISTIVDDNDGGAASLPITTTSTASNTRNANNNNLDHLPYKCTDCSAKFLYESLLIRHYRSTHMKLKPFKCPYCDHAAVAKAALQTHIRCIHTKESPFMCEMCGFRCKTYSILSRHKKVHTGEKPFVCDRCGAAFAEKRNLTSHYWKIHLQSQPYWCALCNVGFYRKDNLLQHERSKHGSGVIG